MPQLEEQPAPQRLVSLDAYRGFVMLWMVSDGLNLDRVAHHFKGNRIWDFIGYQFSHAPWTGCGFWDLIQPSFTFIVGVAMPYSYAARKGKGDSALRTAGHVLFRAFVLTFLGVFLRSNHSYRTNYTFEDVTSQIGLGYAFVFLLLGKNFRVQMAALLALLLGYWALFAFWPLQGADVALNLGVPNDWNKFTGFAAHWNKYLNPAGAFDRWFLNLFPRQPVMDGGFPVVGENGIVKTNPFKFNGGGYQTLSFIPSAATILMGIMAGEMIRGPLSLTAKFRRLALRGVICLALGLAVDGNTWPYWDWHWSLCPIVKRIWTPSWAIFSAGWAFLILAAFLWIIDIQGFRKWTFPLLIVGMNSVAMYVMSYLFKGWVEETWRTHLGTFTAWAHDLAVKGGIGNQWLVDTLQDHSDKKFFTAGTYMPIAESALATFTLWLFCLWLYRKKAFIRI